MSEQVSPTTLNAIEQILRKAVGSDAELSVEPTPVGTIHLWVVSGLFEGLSESQRDRRVWPLLEKGLSSADLLRISVCVLATPAERDGTTEMAAS
jgi:hypothetical protein